MKQTGGHFDSGCSLDDADGSLVIELRRSVDAYEKTGNGQMRHVDMMREAARRIEADAARIEELEAKVIAYCLPHADLWAQNHGFPNRHYHWQYYDDLKDAGARMDDFTRLGPDDLAPGEA